MIDHSEACIALKRHTAALYDAMLNKQFDTARQLCVLIVTEAKLLSSQITIEEDAYHGVHPSGPK